MRNARELNAEYHMFSAVADDQSDGKFIFSADDCLSAKGMLMRCGSRMLDTYKPLFDATCVERMRNAGGKLIGKTNTDEFAIGTFCTNSAYGVPKNPFSAERSCGGPSGGSACAAALIDHISLGIGSVSCPASFCGVYGLMPTYGRVSRYGLAATDKVGLLSSSPEKIEECLPIVSGKDPKDGVSCAQPDLELKGGKITSVAVPEDIPAGVSEKVLSVFGSSLEIIKGMGIEIKKVKMPFLKYALPAHSIIAASETSTGLAKYVGMRYGQQDGDLSLKFDDYFTSFRTEYFGEDTKKKILLGTYVRMSKLRDRYYVKARKVRSYVVASYKKVLEDHDAIVTPSVPFVSPRFDEIRNMPSDKIYNADVFSCPPNLAGMPHISVPCGYDGNGMPIGMQLVTGHWCEDPLITFAKDWDSAFTVKRPEVPL